MNIIDLIAKAIEKNASDLHISVGIPPTMRVNGELEKIDDKLLSPIDTEELIKQILSDEKLMDLDEKGELDFSFSNPGLGRFRVNAYKQRGSYSVAIRVVSIEIPLMEDLGLPPVLKELADKKRGLILVTGPTGSGKSTTLASMIDYINRTRSCHILTLEDPIEYLHKHNKSIVNQREIGHDSKNYANALRASLRQDPDVILVGEMRDLETIGIAITAAETGHLVMSTLHTVGAAKTIDRIIDVFPPYQQQQIKVQLSSVLMGVVSQSLLPKADNSGRIAALEIMIATPAIRNLIREGKNHQIQSIVQTGSRYGMKSMDHSISDLYKSGVITREVALNYSAEKEMMERYLDL